MISSTKGSQMKLKLLITAILCSSLLFAQGSKDSNKSKGLGDDGKPLKVKTRDGYMPNIITPEYAKSGIYGGLGLAATNLKAKSATLSNSQNMLSLSLLAGYNFNEYLAAESRASVSIANENSINVKSLALYLKPQYALYDGLNIYSLLGFGRFSAESPLSSATDAHKTSLQLGFGADYRLPNNFKLFADYTFMGKDGKAQYKNSPASIKSGAFMSGITYDF